MGTIAREHDLSIMASGTHPLAVWSRVKPTPQPRYGKVMHDLQMVGSRTVVCGMHVHVEVPDLSARVDIMNRMQRYLPLLLALCRHPRRSGNLSALGCWATASPPIGNCRARGFPSSFEDAARITSATSTR